MISTNPQNGDTNHHILYRVHNITTVYTSTYCINWRNKSTKRDEICCQLLSAAASVLPARRDLESVSASGAQLSSQSVRYPWLNWDPRTQMSGCCATNRLLLLKLKLRPGELEHLTVLFARNLNRQLEFGYRDFDHPMVNPVQIWLTPQFLVEWI